jgi:hypothetical protein
VDYQKPVDQRRFKNPWELEIKHETCATKARGLNMLFSESVRYSDELYQASKKLERLTALDLRFELRGASVQISGPHPHMRKLARRLRATGIMIGVAASEQGILCSPEILKAIGL